MRLDYLQSNLPEIFGRFFCSKNSATPIKRPFSLLYHVTYLPIAEATTPVLDILLNKTQINHSLVISQPICMKLDSKKR